MKRHLPALDGLRAVAVLLVIGLHAGSAPNGGWIGVDIFFVLSGYLITGILLDEVERTGRVSLLRFYWRRALRLLPALGACVVMALFLAAVARPEQAAATGRQAVTTIAYMANYYPAGDSLLGHTWSLSVEEQFYLAWPLVLIALLRFGGRRGALGGALIGCVAVLAHRCSVSSYAAYFHTDARGDALLIGCAVALAAREGLFDRVHAEVVGAALVVGVLVLTVVGATTIAPGAPVGTYTLVDLAAAAVIVATVVRPRPAIVGALSWGPAVWLGRRSYGMYLYHLPLVAVLQPRLGGTGPLLLAVALPLTVVVAAVSFRYLERPFLRLKDRRVSAPAEVAAAAA